MPNTKSFAGWASCDITPPLGIPLGGRGPRFTAADSILDPLFAQATVLQDASNRKLVLISVDLIELSRPQTDRIAFACACLLGCSPQDVIVNASHTHNGPMMGFARYATLRSMPAELDTYFNWLVDRLIRLVVEARATLTPVAIQWRMGQSNIGINRRRFVDGEVKLAPNDQAPYDRSLWVLELRSTQSPDRRAILFSHACHPVMVYGFAWSSISAEWPGQARIALRQSLGQDVHCQFFQGMAGNIRPRIMADLEKGVFRKASHEDVITTGQNIARDIVSLIEKPGDSIDLKLASIISSFTVTRDEDAMPPASHWEARLNAEDEAPREAARYWLHRMSPEGIPPYPTTPWPVGLIQISPNHLIVWMGGEPVAEWRDVISKALPGQSITAWGYTHDSNGYLVTDALLPEGGYEVHGTWLSNQSPAPLKAGLDAAGAAAFRRMYASLSMM
jgi:neutral ceramidase